MRAILLPLLIVAAAAAPAWAGHRAIYVQEDDTRLVISIADNGDARTDPGEDGAYFLLRNKEFYVVQKIDAAWQTIKLTEFVAALQETGVRIDQLVPDAGDDLPVFSGEVRVVEAGSRTVAGRPGKAYRVYGMPEAEPGQPELFVMSSDPVLAPVARLMEGVTIAMPLLSGNGTDSAAAKLGAAMHMILALGAPLDTGGHLRLEKVEPVDVPAAAMTLPSTPLTKAQLVAGLRAMNSGMSGTR